MAYPRMLDEFVLPHILIISMGRDVLWSLVGINGALAHRLLEVRDRMNGVI